MHLFHPQTVHPIPPPQQAHSHISAASHPAIAPTACPVPVPVAHLALFVCDSRVGWPRVVWHVGTRWGGQPLLLLLGLRCCLGLGFRLGFGGCWLADESLWGELPDVRVSHWDL